MQRLTGDRGGGGAGYVVFWDGSNAEEERIY